MSYLTDEEMECLNTLGQAAGQLRAIIGDGPQAESDWRECAARIHDLQARVMGQAAARAYPEHFRPLGGLQRELTS